MVEGFDIGSLSDADPLTLLANAMSLAFAVRSAFLGYFGVSAVLLGRRYFVFVVVNLRVKDVRDQLRGRGFDLDEGNPANPTRRVQKKDVAVSKQCMNGQGTLEKAGYLGSPRSVQKPF